MISPRDKILLQGLQHRFPIAKTPFKLLAKREGIPESAFLNRIKEFKKRKFIRYISASFNLSSLGAKSTLIGARVPKAKIKRVAGIINSYPQVSHNYLREGEFNLWFTLSAPSRNGLETLIREMKEKTGIEDFLDLRTEKVFKINTVFSLWSKG